MEEGFNGVLNIRIGVLEEIEVSEEKINVAFLKKPKI